MLTSTPTAFANGATGATGTTVRATLNPNSNQTSNANLTAIQNAINAASTAGGGIVRLNAGTYYINGGRIQMRSNVRLEGPARTADSTTTPTAVLKAGANFLQNPEWDGYSMITVYDGGLVNMTAANILVDLSEASFTAAQLPEGARLSAFAVEFRDATNVVLDGVFVKNSYTYHLVIADSVRFGVRNCNVVSTSVGRWNQLDGIHVLNSSAGDVVDNRVDNGAGGTNGDGDDGLVARTAFGGPVTTNVNFRNNWVRAGRHGAGLQIVPDSGVVSNLNIQNNRFDGGSTKTGIHTGYYDGTTASVTGVTVGGSAATANTFIDTTVKSVDFTPGPHSNITVTYNRAVRSGAFSVNSGNNNVASNNTAYTTEPGTEPPPSAGEDQSVGPWVPVTLAGQGSGTWTQVSGLQVTLTGTEAVRSFVAPAAMTPQTLVFAYGGDQVTVSVGRATTGIVNSAGTVTPVRVRRIQ